MYDSCKYYLFIFILFFS
jgi:NADH dehydrogenase (ubiquinone) 1 alpha subcomplex subunit 9